MQIFFHSIFDGFLPNCFFPSSSYFQEPQDSLCVFTQGQYPILQQKEGNRQMSYRFPNTWMVSPPVQIFPSLLKTSVFNTVCSSGNVHCCCQIDLRRRNFLCHVSWVNSRTFLSLPLAWPYVRGFMRQFSLLTVLGHCQI